MCKKKTFQLKDSIYPLKKNKMLIFFLSGTLSPYFCSVSFVLFFLSVGT